MRAGADRLALIEAYFAALSRGDREAWLACFAPEGGLEDPAGTPPRVGRAQLTAFLAEVTGPLAEVDIQPTAIHLLGDTAAVSWRARLSARTGRQTRCEGIDVFQFSAEGRIFKLTGYWDPQAAFADLGLAG
ncbi:MAG TPA: nuclear transport factor 2 family protein [Thiobacillaceae bacterium]|nr:nuclear transport factor 2 family protein [Thiobacillaceae bacterium]HNA80969.1 nuclear transport factor 2 family protein [Thiobacillaceae bacterium]